MTEEGGEAGKVVRVGDEVVVRKANEERTKFGECYIRLEALLLEKFLLILEFQIGKVLPQALRRLGKEDEKLEDSKFVAKRFQYSSIVCQKYQA